MGKRGRKPSKEKKGYYFVEEQEQAVVQYLKTTDENERNRIYNEILHPALCKMVESIINRYKLYVPDENFKETFDDTISFLMTKISLFNPDSGYKAYSYCGTICKNYLILKVKNFNKNIKRVEPYDNVQTELNDNIRLSYQDNTNKNTFLTALISATTKNIENVLSTNKKLIPNEIKIGKALLELLNNWEEILDNMGSNKFNKSSILLYLKETTMLNTKEIRDAMKKYKLLYFNTKENIINEYL